MLQVVRGGEDEEGKWRDRRKAQAEKVAAVAVKAMQRKEEEEKRFEESRQARAEDARQPRVEDQRQPRAEDARQPRAEDLHQSRGEDLRQTRSEDLRQPENSKPQPPIAPNKEASENFRQTTQVGCWHLNFSIQFCFS